MRINLSPQQLSAFVQLARQGQLQRGSKSAGRIATGA
jgi:hypothetical protein